MKVNQLKMGALMSYLIIGLGSLISIVYTPIMLRYLGQSEYGLYNLVASVVSYLGLFNFGFGSAYIKYFAEYKNNKDEESIAKLNGMFMIIFAILGTIAILCGVVLVLNTEAIFGAKLSLAELAKARVLMALMVVNIAITFPCIVFNSYVTANEKFVFQRLLHIIRIVTSPFLILPILILGYGSVGMVIVTTIINFLIEAINVIYSYRKIKINFNYKNLNLTLVRELFIFSSYIFLNLIVNQINWNVDRFIIGRFRGTLEVAVYSVAAQLNSYYLQLSTAISAVYIPRVNALVASKNSDKALSELFTRLGRIQFILLSLILTGLIFFGKVFICLWAGKDYADSYPIVLILSIPLTIPLIQNLGIEIQRAKNMHKFRSWVYFFIAVGNVALSIPLVKLYGGIGAAIGTGLALIIGNVFFMNWHYHNKVGLDIKKFALSIGKVLPTLIIPCLVGVLMMLYLDLMNLRVLIPAIVCYAIIFCCSMWFTGMNSYEKQLIEKPFLKLRLKLKK